MPPLLAYAESPDVSNSDLILILASVGILIIAATLAFALIALARSRRHPHFDAVAALAILWALIFAGSVMSHLVDQNKWSKERMLRIQSGYFDPNDVSDTPAKPLKLWTACGLAYVFIGTWTRIAKPPAN